MSPSASIDPAPESATFGNGDGPSFEHLPGDPATGLLILCDHASNALPPDYGALGLPPAEFERHIAYDIGAAWLTRRLAAATGAPALLTRWSRLLIDPNRGEDDPTLIMRLSDGAVVPGNRTVDAAERERRIARYHRPYHQAIAAAIDASLAAGQIPVLFSVHSFTPFWKGVPRPWQVTVLWDNDPRLPKALLAALEAEGDLVIGDNEPYHGALAGDTLYTHATRRGLPHALVEVRQDLIARREDAEAMADRFARLLPPLLAHPGLREIRHHGSLTGPVPPHHPAPEAVS